MARKYSDQKNGSRAASRNRQEQSIGNQQGTTQTGAQNSGGRDRRQQEDNYSRDLRKSGNRKSRD